MKVRQPLSEIFYFFTKFKKLSLDLEEIIKEKLNIKNILWAEETPTQEDVFWTGSEDIRIAINTELTDELEKEGEYRELVRAIQDTRKKQGLTPSDVIVLTLPENTKATVAGFEEDLKKTVLAQSVTFSGSGIVVSK